MTEVSGDSRTPPAEVLQEVNADIPQWFEPYDWQRSLSASVAAHAAKTAARRREREQLAVARNHGLNRRHANKLNRTSSPTVVPTTTDEPRSQQ